MGLMLAYLRQTSADAMLSVGQMHSRSIASTTMRQTGKVNIRCCGQSGLMDGSDTGVHYNTPADSQVIILYFYTVSRWHYW